MPAAEREACAMGKFDNLGKTLWILVFCKSCGHCREVDKDFCIGFAKRVGISTDDLSQSHFESAAGKFRCAMCGDRGARVEFERGGKLVSRLKDARVATANSVERVFHRPRCGWMSRVPSIDEIRFPNRDAALQQGYQPCKNCKP
jgi:hypothetical protein